MRRRMSKLATGIFVVWFLTCIVVGILGDVIPVPNLLWIVLAFPFVVILAGVPIALLALIGDIAKKILNVYLALFEFLGLNYKD